MLFLNYKTTLNYLMLAQKRQINQWTSTKKPKISIYMWISSEKHIQMSTVEKYIKYSVYDISITINLFRKKNKARHLP